MEIEWVYCAVRTKSLNTNQVNFNSRAMAQAVCHLPLTAEARVSARTIIRGICGGQSCTGTGFSLSTLVFLCQNHSTTAPYSFKFTYRRRYTMPDNESYVKQHTNIQQLRSASRGFTPRHPLRTNTEQMVTLRFSWFSSVQNTSMQQPTQDLLRPNPSLFITRNYFTTSHWVLN